MLIIRQESISDAAAVYSVVKQAFEYAEHSDGDEPDLVRRLHHSNAFIPELSLVAEDNNQIVGHIMFTKLNIGDSVQLALAPLSVKPERQKQGIGGSLILAGHQIARDMEYDYSVLIGHPSYYPRFGYTDAARYNIRPPFKLPAGVFMAAILRKNAAPVAGTAKFAPEFFRK